MERLKVRFGKPEHGWINIQIGNSMKELSLNISYTPFHFIEELIEAVIKILDGESAEAHGSYNPERYEFIFKTENNIVHLQVKSSPDHRTIEDLSEVLFDYRGNNSEVCKSFWRGFKDLEGKCSAQRFEQLFRREFPSRNLTFLSEKISALKHS